MDEAFISQLCTLENLSLQVAVSLLLILLASALPRVVETPVYARIAPLAPVLLCVLGTSVLPFGSWGDLPPMSRVTLGIALGITAGWAHKLVKQTLLGRDDRIDQHANPLPMLALLGAGGMGAGILATSPESGPVVQLPTVVITSSTSSTAGGAQ